MAYCKEKKLLRGDFLNKNHFNAENYMILAGIRVSFSLQVEVSHVIKKNGSTSIEFFGFVDDLVGDWSLAEAGEIKRVLRDVSVRIRNSGCEPCISTASHNMNGIEKADDLSWHSVKLAVAYGLMKNKSPAAIRIVKGGRVCADCYEVTDYQRNSWKRNYCQGSGD